MNKTAKTVAFLHSTAFTLFFIITTVMNFFVYPYMYGDGISNFLKIFIETVISAFLYTILYLIVKFAYSVIVFRIINKKLNLKGNWYHVIIKKNLHGFVKTDKLRAGETVIRQNLYDLDFEGNNAYYSLSKDGKPHALDSAVNNTHWSLKISRWDGDENILGCFKAGTSTKDAITHCPYCGTSFEEKKPVEKEERIGIHNLQIINENYIKGKFADEYPSASFGEIYFFRKEKDRDNLIADFLQDGNIDGTYN